MTAPSKRQRTLANHWKQLISFAIADFNGDGIPDLAGTSYNNQAFTGTVSVLLGNGDGTFTAISSYPLRTIATSLMTGDFDGDGKLDVAVADDTDGRLYVFWATKTGHFRIR